MPNIASRIPQARTRGRARGARGREPPPALAAHRRATRDWNAVMQCVWNEAHGTSHIASFSFAPQNGAFVYKTLGERRK